MQKNYSQQQQKSGKNRFYCINEGKEIVRKENFSLQNIQRKNA